MKPAVIRIVDPADKGAAVAKPLSGLLDQLAGQLGLPAVGAGDGHQIEWTFRKVGGALNFNGRSHEVHPLAGLAGGEGVEEPAADRGGIRRLGEVSGKLSPSERRA